MTKIMIASEEFMTDGQIDNLANKLRDAARKYRKQFGKGHAQDVLELENIGMELLAPFRSRVEAVSSMIVRPGITVDRKRSSKAALKATGRNLYVDDAVVEIMPRGEGEEVEMIFFKPEASCYDSNGLISRGEVKRQCEMRSLVPDPRAQAAFNEANPAFADEKPNGCYWQDADGNWYFAAFGRWSGERCVNVGRHGRDWPGLWWFGGVRQVSKKPLDS